MIIIIIIIIIIMNSFQLKRILETDVMPKHAFQGVYASDQLKQIPKPSTLPATHQNREHIG